MSWTVGSTTCHVVSEYGNISRSTTGLHPSIQDYSRSPFFEEAQFRIGYCVLKSARSIDRDQTEARDALRIFTDFLEISSSPFADSAQKYLKITNDRLAEKEFNEAKFYQKLGEKDAAIIYYKAFIQDYPGSDYAVQAQLEMSRLLIELNRKPEAKEVLNGLSAQGKTGEIGRQIQELLDRCKE